ncbi:MULTISPECIES: hypothetical protein [unclassified Synechocystis]|jgi:hypothetical protein|uniref:hypothetical protein n=1 Tax=unclassified Synechocystis TaxID=2640012 RepID=UPI0011875FD8|nr:MULTISPECIES: hypothetical protein [unclassified Synechocystis]MCT0252338.1 hypothetical protein [Synechocystis sp. CS-94]
MSPPDIDSSTHYFCSCGARLGSPDFDGLWSAEHNTLCPWVRDHASRIVNALEIDDPIHIDQVLSDVIANSPSYISHVSPLRSKDIESLLFFIFM